LCEGGEGKDHLAIGIMQSETKNQSALTLASCAIVFRENEERKTKFLAPFGREKAVIV